MKKIVFPIRTLLAGEINLRIMMLVTGTAVSFWSVYEYEIRRTLTYGESQASAVNMRRHMANWQGKRVSMIRITRRSRALERLEEN